MLLGSGAENYTCKPSIGSITVPRPSRLDSSLMNAPAVAHDPHRISPTATATTSLENGADRVCIHTAWSEENKFAWYPAPTRGKARCSLIFSYTFYSTIAVDMAASPSRATLVRALDWPR